MKRTEDGSQGLLVFFDPAQIRKLGLDPYEVDTRRAEVPVRFEAPLAFEPRDVVQERLAIELTEASLVIQWGSSRSRHP